MNQSYTLTDLQQSSIDRLKQMNACVIALSPGCGKTILILHHIINNVLKDNNDKCIFFIPKSARASFIKEMTTRMHEEFILICAGTNYSYNEIAKHRFIFIENTIVNKYIETLVSLASTNTCHLVIDEAHSLQNPESVFSQAAWEVRCYCKYVFAMTATPLLNNIEGLFNLYHFVYPRIFTSWFRFRARYCITQDHVIRMKNKQGKLIERKVTDIVGYQNMKELNEILDKLTIKGCVHYNVNFDFVECQLDSESEKPYKLASNGLFDLLYHPEKAKQRLSKRKLPKDKEHSISDDAKDFGSRLHDLQRIVDGCDESFDKSFVSNKMKALCQKVFEIIQRNESTLIYFEYTDSLEMAERILLEQQSMLGFTKIYRLTGAEKEEYRAKIEANLGLKEIILCSQAASQSRNLQRANNIIVYNCPFSIGRTIQTLGRICRCDSTYDHQNIYFISAANTIDTYKTSLFKNHTSLINSLLGIEALGTLESLDDTCNYLDVDVGAEKKMLKNTMLWRRESK